MVAEYLLRGKIIPELAKEDEYAIPEIVLPASLPITLGQFTIDRSPNWEAYIEEIIEGEIRHEVDTDYPLSLYYVDVRVKVDDEDSPIPKAQEALRNLEAMLRLHQPGGIYIRREWQVYQIEDGSPRETILLHFGSAPPEPDLYSLGGYKFDDEFLVKFSDFFNMFWGVIENKHQPIYNSLLRFSSSYEKFTSADRLIDLMISLEALFNESPDSIAYKVSLRCSQLIGINKEEKTAYFKDLKRFYADRNAIVHGDKKDIEKDKARVDYLEKIVRKAIVDFLSLDIKGFPIKDLAAFDDSLLFQ